MAKGEEPEQPRPSKAERRAAAKAKLADSDDEGGTFLQRGSPSTRAKGKEPEQRRPLSREERRAAAKAKLPDSDDDDEKVKKVVKKLPEVGSIHRAKVIHMADFGAFFSLGEYADGLAHLSELTAGRVARRLASPDEVLELGQEAWVQVREVKDGGKVSLSVKAVDQATGRPREKGAPPAETKSEKKKVEVPKKPVKEKKPFLGLTRRNGTLSKAGRERQKRLAKRKKLKSEGKESGPGPGLLQQPMLREKKLRGRKAQAAQNAASLPGRRSERKQTRKAAEIPKNPAKAKEGKAAKEKGKSKAPAMKAQPQRAPGEQSKRSLKRERQLAKKKGLPVPDNLDKRPWRAPKAKEEAPPAKKQKTKEE